MLNTLLKSCKASQLYRKFSKSLIFRKQFSHLTYFTNNKDIKSFLIGEISRKNIFFKNVLQNQNFSHSSIQSFMSYRFAISIIVYFLFNSHFFFLSLFWLINAISPLAFLNRCPFKSYISIPDAKTLNLALGLFPRTNNLYLKIVFTFGMFRPSIMMYLLKMKRLA